MPRSDAQAVTRLYIAARMYAYYLRGRCHRDSDSAARTQRGGAGACHHGSACVAARRTGAHAHARARARATARARAAARAGGSRAY